MTRDRESLDETVRHLRALPESDWPEYKRLILGVIEELKDGLKEFEEEDEARRKETSDLRDELRRQPTTTAVNKLNNRIAVLEKDLERRKERGRLMKLGITIGIPLISGLAAAITFVIHHWK